MSRPAPIFISYARTASADHAKRLRAALQREGIEAFLDVAAIGSGAQISESVVEGILNASVFVAFATETYFTRRYCLEELELALAALRVPAIDRLLESDLPESCEYLVLARPVSRVPENEWLRLPLSVRDTYWPQANETAQLARVIRQRLERCTESIGERLIRLGLLPAAKLEALTALALPVPARLGTIRSMWTSGHLRESIGDRFLGRTDDIWRVHETLVPREDDRSRAYAACTVQAGAGVGKTRLAVEYARRFAPRFFPGGLFWVDANRPSDQLEAQLHAILSVLEPDTPPLPALRAAGIDVASRLREALQDLSQPALYVVDGVPEPLEPSEPPPLET